MTNNTPDYTPMIPLVSAPRQDYFKSFIKLSSFSLALGGAGVIGWAIASQQLLAGFVGAMGAMTGSTLFYLSSTEDKPNTQINHNPNEQNTVYFPLVPANTAASHS